MLTGSPASRRGRPPPEGEAGTHRAARGHRTPARLVWPHRRRAHDSDPVDELIAVAVLGHVLEVVHGGLPPERQAGQGGLDVVTTTVVPPSPRPVNLPESFRPVNDRFTGQVRGRNSPGTGRVAGFHSVRSGKHANSSACAPGHHNDVPDPQSGRRRSPPRNYTGRPFLRRRIPRCLSQTAGRIPHVVLDHSSDVAAGLNPNQCPRRAVPPAETLGGRPCGMAGTTWS